MDNIIIVSIYDSGWGFSVMLDNKIHEGHFFSEDDSKIYTSFRKAYHRICSQKKFVRWIRRKYPQQKIIICEDGNIQIYKPRKEQTK